MVQVQTRLLAAARLRRQHHAVVVDTDHLGHLAFHLDQAARQAEGVTRSLLTFTHKARTEKIPTDMGSAVTESIHLLRRVLPDSIALTLDIEENAKLWVHGDAVQLQQVIMNLAVNARDAMPEGGELNISLNHAGDTVVLMVRDTGMGMTNDVRARIFEPFFTTKPRGRGTGLGLAVIHGIIREHAGQIDVSSTVGEGTRFTISLPFCETPPQQEPQLKPREKTLAGDASGVIVLVDSHDYVRAMMASTLRKLGYDVIDAASVESAMNLFGACGQRADLAILDIDEPGSGSRACLDDLRRTNEGMPAVLLTSEPDIDDEVQSAPNTRTLQKPFKMPKLIEAVEIVSRKPEGD